MASTANPGGFLPPPGSPEWFADEDRKRNARGGGHDRFHNPQPGDRAALTGPLQCKAIPCQWGGVYGECIMGCQPGPTLDQDAAAIAAYNHHAANHPTIHANRFPSWSEMGEGDRDVWRARARPVVMKPGMFGALEPEFATPTMNDTETVNGLPVCAGATLTSSPSRPMIPAGVADIQLALDAIIYDQGMTLSGRVEAVVNMIAQEVARAITKWPPNTDSPHHHMGVLREEVDEMWDEVKRDNIRLAREECLQVAAMAIRFILEADLPKHRRKPSEAPKPRPNCPGCGSHPPYHRVGCTHIETIERGL